MSDYANALARLRTLLAAHNAVTRAVEEATEHVLREASKEAQARHVGVAHVMNETVCMPDMDTLPRATTESGFHPRRSLLDAAQAIVEAHDGRTKSVTRKVGSVDIEQYIVGAWRRAETDGARARVREMVENATRSGALDPDAVERMSALTSQVA